MNKKRIIIWAITAMMLTPATVQAKETADSLNNETEKSEERNVMLNASDATKPREIQIGLPSEDVNVYENGLPAVYSSTVHQLARHWRSNAGQGKVGLLNPMESAIKTGNIAYSVDTYSNLGQKEFKGVVNYHTNSFGWQNVDMNVSGSIGDDWLYNAGTYQNFDPGNFDPKFTDYTDRTQLYYAGITRLLNKGKLSLIYKYSKSDALCSMVNSAPFIYKGDGSVKEIPGFSLGTSSYAPAGGEFQYMDVMDGKIKTGRWGDFTNNEAHEATVLFEYTPNNTTALKLNAKYMNAPHANFVDYGGSTIFQADTSDNLFTGGSETPYTGLVEGRRSWLHIGKVSNLLLTGELVKKSRNHKLRLGLNEWHYKLNYHSSSFQWTGTVSEYPDILTKKYDDGTSDKFRGFNELSPEYTKGYENKLAMYLTDNWNITPKLRLYFGGRLEYYRMSAKQIPFGRYPGFHIGDTHTYTTADGISQTVTITPRDVVKDKLNYAATL